MGSPARRSSTGSSVALNVTQKYGSTIASEAVARVVDGASRFVPPRRSSVDVQASTVLRRLSVDQRGVPVDAVGNSNHGSHAAAYRLRGKQIDLDTLHNYDYMQSQADPPFQSHDNAVHTSLQPPRPSSSSLRRPSTSSTISSPSAGASPVTASTSYTRKLSLSSNPSGVIQHPTSIFSPNEDTRIAAAFVLPLSPASDLHVPLPNVSPQYLLSSLHSQNHSTLPSTDTITDRMRSSPETSQVRSIISEDTHIDSIDVVGAGIHPTIDNHALSFVISLDTSTQDSSLDRSPSSGSSSASIASNSSGPSSTQGSGLISFRTLDADSDRDSPSFTAPRIKSPVNTTPPGLYSTFIKSSLDKLTSWKTAAATATTRAMTLNDQHFRTSPTTFATHLTTSSAADGDDDDDENDDVDWEFWGNVIQDYETVSRKQHKTLSRVIQAGIPPKLRGTLWQLLCRSASVDISPQTYLDLVRADCPFEKLIQRDLARTFPNHPYFSEKQGAGQESLFNVLKAYASYDPEVGYCQGLSFVVGPLLLNMPEEEAFAVLFKMMRSYGLRGHYTPHMEGLHMRLFQFDKLLQELLPAVYQHLAQEGIRPTMYASQWFMTIFAYRFPMELVLRVLDIIFAEGVDALLRFSLALMKKNQTTILSLEFESLAEFLKTGLFEHYLVDVASSTGQHSVAARANEFVADGLSVKLTKRQLDRISAKYDQELKLSDPHVMLVEQLKTDNRTMDDKVKILEHNLTMVNQEHVDLANELIQTKVDYSRLREANAVMGRQVYELRSLVLNEGIGIDGDNTLRSPNGGIDRASSAMDIGEVNNISEQEMSRLRIAAIAKAKFKAEADIRALTEKNEMLMMQLDEMQNALIHTKLALAESEEARAATQKKLSELRRALG